MSEQTREEQLAGDDGASDRGGRMSVETIRELPRSASGADQVLVRKEGRYYVVSSVVAPLTGYETLVFKADENGEVTQWGEVAGGRGMDRAGAIAQLAMTDEEGGLR